MICRYISPQQGNWDDLLPMAEFVTNTACEGIVEDMLGYMIFCRHSKLHTGCNLVENSGKVPSAADYILQNKAMAKARKCL